MKYILGNDATGELILYLEDGSIFMRVWNPGEQCYQNHAFAPVAWARYVHAIMWPMMDTDAPGGPIMPWAAQYLLAMSPDEFPVDAREKLREEIMRYSNDAVVHMMGVATRANRLAQDMGSVMGAGLDAAGMLVQIGFNLRFWNRVVGRRGDE